MIQAQDLEVVNDYVDSYQRWVDSTCIGDHSDDVLWAMIALNSEVGELSQMMEKRIRKGTTFTTDEVNSEIGDVLWYVARLASMHDIKLSDVMEYNINKIEERMNKNVTTQED